MEESETKPEQTTGSTDEPEVVEAVKINTDKPEKVPAPTSQPELTTILIGVSQSTKGYPHPSQSSLYALDWVLTKLIHKSCRNEFKLLVLHVKVPDEDGVDEVDSLYATHADFDATKRKDMEKCMKLLGVFVKKCKEAEVPAEGWVKVGDPKEAIIDEVARVKPDLLILGSRGLGPLQRIFVGGVSRYCAGKVECPVLVIKRRPEDMPEDASED